MGVNNLHINKLFFNTTLFVSIFTFTLLNPQFKSSFRREKLKSSNYKAIFFILLIISVTVMSSGCAGPREEEANEEENAKNQTQANDTNPDEVNNEVDQTKKESTSDNQVTTSKTEKKTSTPTKTESCSHPSVTTKYVGMDKATGKVIYDTYCSKCGEYLGRVKY